MFQGSGVAGRMAHWMRNTVDCQVIYVCMGGWVGGWMGAAYMDLYTLFIG